MTIVCDTSPLLLFARAGRLDLCSTLYQTVIVPGAVLEEITVQADDPAGQIRACLQRDAFRQKTAREQDLEAVRTHMGRGERAALARARAMDSWF